METLKSTPTTIAKHKLTIELATEGFFFVKARQMEHHMVRRLPGVIDDVGMTDYTLGATSIRRGDQYFPRLMNKTIKIDISAMGSTDQALKAQRRIQELIVELSSACGVGVQPVKEAVFLRTIK